MYERSKDVIRESKTIESVTKELTGGMNEISSKVDHINDAVPEVHTIIEENKENIDGLVQEVSRFKIE